MRKVIIRTFTALSLFTISVQSLWANEVRNGGQLVAVQFVARSWSILEYLELSQTNLLTDIQRLRLHTALTSTQVVAVPGPLLSNDGLTVDARVVTDASGHRVIELDRDKWKFIIESPDSYMLILHEYLRVLGLPDDHYEISGRLQITAARIPMIKPGVYQVGNDSAFEITPDQHLIGVNGKYWPFIYYVNEMGSNRSFRYRADTSSFIRFDVTTQEFITTTKNSAVDYRCGARDSHVKIIPSRDGNSLELAFNGVDQVSGGCVQAYINRIYTWTATRVVD